MPNFIKPWLRRCDDRYYCLACEMRQKWNSYEALMDGFTDVARVRARSRAGVRKFLVAHLRCGHHGW